MNEDGTAINLVDLINRLSEPPAPEPVSLVPQTAGWWVVGVLMLLALASGIWRIWRHWRAEAYRRVALRQLDRAAHDPAAIAMVLRRAALAAYPRREVAGLAGEDWVAFLRRTGDFPIAAALALTRGPYTSGSDAGQLRKAAEHWIRTHRRAP
jgi:hypothetical protein